VIIENLTLEGAWVEMGDVQPELKQEVPGIKRGVAGPHL